ncbi:hypothetical protein MHYP_G00181070 [Metynnis hypsauchen]
MGTLTMLRVWVLSVAAVLNGLSAQETGINVDHNMQVCSTWGNFHFSTFDGQFFQLPYTCNYILTTLCDSTKTDFNIQMRRQYINNLPTISSFTIKIDGVVVKLLDGNITMNDQAVTIPSYQFGVRIDKTTSYIKISSSKLEIAILWDQHNYLSVEIPTKYRNQTCGLCGDSNGVKDNEFIENGAQLTEEEYGHKWKMDAPTESCEEIELHTKKCQSQTTACKKLLSHPAFSSCDGLLPIEAFVEACVRDVCQCNSSQALCLCDTVSEFSRQCAHAGGKPQSWRTNKLCGKECPFNLEHRECGNPCKDTCSNQEGSLVCNEHCSDGCFCPAGTVFNDIEENDCIPVHQCPCIHKEKVYQPGESYNTTCQKCVCSEGRWSCVNLDCPGSCSIQGGSHITTYDGKAYNFHGNCYYVLSKDSINDVAVLGHLVQCGQTETETCMTDVKFIVSKTTVTFSSSGSVLVNEITTKLPILSDDVTVFKPSTFYIIARTSGLLLVIQMVPVMQVYIVASSKKKGTLSGLCGNFNDDQTDDFKTKLGLTEGTGATFANTWKAMSNCPDISISQENPCSMSVEKEKYAREWCNMLIKPKGVFSPCHAEVNPKDYRDRCIYDTCNCAKSEECMCAAVSSYVYACSAKGVWLHGWRNAICDRFSKNCPGNMEYYYSLNSCGTTCRSLSGYDRTCNLIHTPVDGCGCAKGTYLNDKGECVPASSCPCYYNNQIVAPSQVINKYGTACTCTLGNLHCIGQQQVPICKAPMYFFNCSNAAPEASGIECQRSCQILDSDQCVSTQCTSGCMCPDGLLADGQGGCVKEENCPCVYNGVFYQPGQAVKADCNTCTCSNGTWSCTQKDCPGTCTIYGDGHYITFDGRRYSFSGDCEYTLVQDYCSNTLNGSFRVITENIPCGTTGTTCSKSIKIFLGNKELLLSEENIKVFIYDNSTEIPYKFYTMGIYLVIEASHGLVLFWDKKTSLMIKLEPSFKGTVCGLCGNYDGNGKNDFVTRGGEEVVETLEFGNSWRVSPTCPKASSVNSSCDVRPHRRTWAEKHCSIIKSDVFSPCHSLVDPAQYYDICVQDTCACDTGGDCECFCTAVAAYAAACNEKGACISWRTPTICPLFCDYYNSDDGCEWHYRPCGQCVKTCRNPSGVCFSQTLAEGCFPKCPSDKPYLNETTMECVLDCCLCYVDGQCYKDEEEIPTKETCKKWNNIFLQGSFIYNVTDGTGWCITAYCDAVCNVHKETQPCHSTSPPTKPTTTTTTPTNITATTNHTAASITPTTTATPPTTTPHCIYLSTPRKNGETWTEKCWIKKCVNGIITTERSTTPPVCANGMPAVELENGCYECTCRCMGWGDPHYVTFDGQYYAFQGDCTYVLVQEIIKKYNFSVHIKNYFCDTVHNLACPESLTIYYKSYKIDLIQTRNPTVNKVFINGAQIIPTYSNSDFRITTTGIQMTVDIPAIQAQIDFAGLNFVINLPFSLFYNNTEGQCGVCDNITENDCRLRSGEIQACETMAQNWTVTTNSTPPCFLPTTTTTTTTTTKTPTSTTTKTPASVKTPTSTTPKTPTPTSTTITTVTEICDISICKIINSKVFEQCHQFYPPENFYKACKYDVCNMRNATGCYSLESYATLCAQMSVCVDWRNFTNGVCEYKCSSPKVYQACGPVVEETCNSRYNDKFVDCKSEMCQGFKEGCFCPNGTTLFDTTTGVCTPFCGCVGPDGFPRTPRDKWNTTCEDCECREETMGPVCTPVQCPAVGPCDKPGYVIKKEKCCEKCVCDPPRCPSGIVTCEIGFELFHKTEDDCCPTFSCKPKHVCVVNGTEYMHGAKIQVDICKNCICGSTVDTKTGLLTADCSPVVCNKNCSEGFTHVPDPEKCCGKCVQQKCVYTDQNSTVYTIEVGESFTPLNEKCVKYNCTKVNNAFELVVIISSCPAFNPENCVNGTVTSTPDGCCKTCKIKDCRIEKNNTYLVANNCTSVHSVEITSCDGYCDTSSIYSMAANSLMHRCSCCQELRTSIKQVEMNCPDQRQITYTYTYVEECGCQVTKCKDKESSD